MSNVPKPNQPKDYVFSIAGVPAFSVTAVDLTDALRQLTIAGAKLGLSDEMELTELAKFVKDGRLQIPE